MRITVAPFGWLYLALAFVACSSTPAADAGSDAAPDGQMSMDADASDTMMSMDGVSNSLVGSWTAMTTSNGSTVTVVLTINADGTASQTVSASGMCSGTITTTAFMWSATGMRLSFTGSPMCSGMWLCASGDASTSLDCATFAGMGGLLPPSCDFVFDSATMFTTSNCTGGAMSLTYTRS